MLRGICVTCKREVNVRVPAANTTEELFPYRHLRTDELGVSGKPNTNGRWCLGTWEPYKEIP